MLSSAKDAKEPLLLLLIDLACEEKEESLLLLAASTPDKLNATEAPSPFNLTELEELKWDDDPPFDLTSSDSSKESLSRRSICLKRLAAVLFHS